VVIASSATEQVGRSTFLRPAFAASDLIALGVMSGEPTIASRWMFERTSLRPVKPITIAPMPNATRRTPAMTPPISQNLFMTFPPVSRGLALTMRVRRPLQSGPPPKPRCGFAEEPLR
jgi:hypothetical protein